MLIYIIFVAKFTICILTKTGIYETNVCRISFGINLRAPKMINKKEISGSCGHLVLSWVARFFILIMSIWLAN